MEKKSHIINTQLELSLILAVNVNNFIFKQPNLK